jgi:hypothetical protein
MADIPVAHLESLRFRCNQLIESIQTLQRTIEYAGLPYMPAWPEILAKYNVLVSHSLNLSNALAAQAPLNTAVALPFPGLASASSSANSKSPACSRIVLHPRVPVSDAALDSELALLLRTQQTLDVIRAENATVRRLAMRMRCRGSIGVLESGAGGDHATKATGGKKVEYEDVLRECEEIRVAHDQRAERAVRAVMMLRERFDWRARVEVEVEEPEELEWEIPHAAAHVHAREEADEVMEDVEHGAGEEDGEGDKVGGHSSEEEGDEVEGELVDALVNGATTST